ncbi:MAG: NAD(P) transhydrogenase subunit alpha [Pyrinomonadaceae bacterium]|nr:NAD(P) transhydrogenase subunit alpha [Pyrinomonadaceae bacterium]
MIFLILIASETTNFTAETLIPALYVFALAAFLGYQVISRVPPLLHTPLMSATNAISGISLVGSIVIAGQYGTVSRILGFIAVACATTNVVGGFMLTDRMLQMFKKRLPAGKEKEKELAAKEKKGLASSNNGDRGSER